MPALVAEPIRLAPPSPNSWNAAMEPSDITVGRHPEYGIVAHASPNLSAGQWMLDRLGFRRLPDHPQLHVLRNQQEHSDARARTAQAVAAMRSAGLTVDADAEFEPAEPSPPAPDHGRHRRAMPDAAFAEHPRFGMVAALDDGAVLSGRLLEEQGWCYNRHLGIYALPDGMDRSEALGHVVRATLALQHAGLQVAVDPRLAQAVTERPSDVARTATHHESRSATSPMNTAALARSPAVANLHGTPLTTAPAETPTNARAADPRIDTSRHR